AVVGLPLRHARPETTDDAAVPAVRRRILAREHAVAEHRGRLDAELTPEDLVLMGAWRRDVDVILTRGRVDGLQILRRPTREQARRVRARDVLPEDELVTLLLAERSEEHTSELQSRENLVCRLLLE